MLDSNCKPFFRLGFIVKISIPNRPFVEILIISIFLDSLRTAKICFKQNFTIWGNLYKHSFCISIHATIVVFTHVLKEVSERLFSNRREQVGVNYSIFSHGVSFIYGLQRQYIKNMLSWKLSAMKCCDIISKSCLRMHCIQVITKPRQCI